MELLKRVSVNPKIFNDKPIIRGMRLKVETVLSLMERGISVDGILVPYRSKTPIKNKLFFKHLSSTF